jgi:hypothetical protein
MSNDEQKWSPPKFGGEKSSLSIKIIFNFYG